jgi:F0F1-type ATP synthase membrane subunit b/b'
MKSGPLLAAATALLIGATSYAQEVVKDAEKAAKSTAHATEKAAKKTADSQKSRA